MLQGMASTPRANIIILRQQASNGLWRWDRINVTQNGAATVAASGTVSAAAEAAGGADAAVAAAVASDPTNTTFEVELLPAHAF
jgi:hypothetical protein